MVSHAKKILVIGDKGQLGSEFIKQPIASDMHLIRASDVSLDITNQDECLRHLDQLSPDFIVNAAAYTAVDAAEKNQQQAFLVNGEAPKILAQWCYQNDSFLCHISTDYVFSGKKSLYNVYTEGEKTGPVSVYGNSKLQGEMNIAAAMPNNYAILRTAWLYGFYGNNFLKTMLKLTLANPDRQFKVVNDQFGSPTSTMALSRQIDSLLKCINHQIKDEVPSGIFHATSTGYCSWYDFACEFFRLMNVEHNLVPCSTQEYPTAASRPMNSILENKHLDDLGMNTFKAWQQDLSDFVERHGDDLFSELG